MQRAALAASALSLLSLTALTACGGGTDPDRATGEPAPTASQAKQVTPAERLAELVVTKAEAKGYTVRKPAAGDALAESQEDMRVDKAACAPLAYATNELPVGAPEASLTRSARGSTVMQTYITLATYADGKAEAAMKELADAVDACGSGYTASSGQGRTTYTSVKKETAPSMGDESVGTASTFDYRGLPQTVRTQTFRFGETIVTYFTVDSSAFVYGRPGMAKIPADLVKAQNAKLG